MTSLNQRLISLESNAGTTSGTITIADVENLQTTLNTKQNTLTAGTNISIVNNLISATGSSGGTITIADVDNLQTSLDNKQNSILSTTNISCNTLSTIGNLSIGGIISAPDQVRFKSSRTTSTTVNINITLPFDKIVENVGGGYNNSTFTFTAPVAGTYYFYTQIFTSGNNPFRADFFSGSTRAMRISREGSSGAGGNTTFTGSLHYYLNAGDTMRMIKVDEGIINLPIDPFCFFGGYLLG